MRNIIKWLYENNFKPEVTRTDKQTVVIFGEWGIKSYKVNKHLTTWTIFKNGQPKNGFDKAKDLLNFLQSVLRTPSV